MLHGDGVVVYYGSHTVLNVLCSMTQENRKDVWEVGCVCADIRVFADMSSHQWIHSLCP